ncbi:sensor histidine kinase [Actinoplanes solisilvae]|uniref:sensor histidine kinase n=1 Tax=Actinoplanes solisilvae TaxID=2486853 RepID=UPI000FDBDF6B|nr:HAMP domain-containing sensor histidine kinase [Actinoplanes solisilvae]
MRKKLLLTYLTLTAVILLMLEVPLALSYSLNAYHQLAGERARETRELATDARVVLGSRTLVAPFEERLRRYEAGRQTKVVLVDLRGRVAAASHTDVDGTASALRSSLAQALQGESAGPSQHARHALWPGDVVIAEPVLEDGEVVGALGAVASGAAVQRDVTRHALLLLGAAVLALTAVGLASVPLTRWLLRPLRQFDDTVRSILDGAYDVRVRVGGGPPEMRGLADGFNRMADHLVTLLDTQRAFVADASHQMRNPLTALRLRVETLDPGERPQSRRQLRQAVAEIERLSQMLDQLLRLARAEGRDQSVAPVHVAEAVTTRVDAWERAAVAKRVTLIAPDPTGTVAACVPGHLEQILDVLIDNAIHASDAGTAITVRHRAAGAYAQIQVVDEGVGMSAEDCQRALGRFWRGTNSARREGSGLGLAIADTLAKANGGSLRLLPVTPRGTEARLEIPLCPRTVPATETQVLMSSCTRNATARDGRFAPTARATAAGSVEDA